MNVSATPIAGVYVVERTAHGDDRGFLERLFCRDALQAAGWEKPVAQINHTMTRHAGTVRGMHFQHPPHAEMKLVTCVAGEIWDVAVDLRPESPTFLQWHAECLSAANGRGIVIPVGCAHGFQSLTDNCSLIYAHTAAYVPASEDGVRHDDPALAIAWPLAPRHLSPRDLGHPLIVAPSSKATPRE